MTAQSGKTSNFRQCSIGTLYHRMHYPHWGTGIDTVQPNIDRV